MLLLFQFTAVDRYLFTTFDDRLEADSKVIACFYYFLTRELYEQENFALC